MSAIIQLQSICKTYNNGKSNAFLALQNIDISFETGKMYAVCGTSGAGKTTLLNIIGLADTATSGQYFLDGKNVESASDAKQAELRNRYFGYVLQDYALLEAETVYENVSIPLIFSKKKSKSFQSLVRAALEAVGMENHIKTQVSKLSGGQKQRVAIGSAIASKKEIMVFDEPTSGLDYRHMLEVSNCLKKLSAIGKTSLIITHDPELIAECCDYFIFIEDGTVKWYGPFDTQNGQRVQQFFGSEEGGAL